LNSGIIGLTTNGEYMPTIQVLPPVETGWDAIAKSLGQGLQQGLNTYKKSMFIKQNFSLTDSLYDTTKAVVLCIKYQMP